MNSSRHPIESTEEAVLKAKVAQLCDFVGYHAITQESSNILVDIYRRTIHQLARHCKDAANNNRRFESTFVDLVQAYDYIGINIPELQEYIETNKQLPSIIKIEQEEQQKPSNQIQRNVLVDDLLEAEKNSHLEDKGGDDGDKLSESGLDEEEKPSVPLLKDTYVEIANKFGECTPVVADKKIRLGEGRVLLLANTKLKISAPIPPAEPEPSTSGLDSRLSKKKKRVKEDELTKGGGDILSSQTTSPVKQTKSKKRKKLSREFVLPQHDSDKELEAGEIKLKVRGEKKKTKLKLKGERKTRVKKEERKTKVKEKSRIGKRPYNKRAKVPPVVPILDPEIAEPPSFFSLIGEEPPIVIKAERQSPSEKAKNENKAKRRKRSLEDDGEPQPVAKTSIVTKESKGRGRKKQKTLAITPLDPSIAEPPSFFPILETPKVVPDLVPDFEEESTASRLPTPLPPIKQSTSKGKKKKKSSNQFAIVTETVTDADKDEKEWFCPACGLSEDGDWVQCDSCQDWYHLVCTGLKKAPEDDENWECKKCCSRRVKAQQKKLQAPIEVMKLKTPDLVVKTPPPPPVKQQELQPSPQPKPPVPQPQTSSGTTSQDDLCPECNLPDDGTMMIQCDDPFCARWFHGKCVNLLEEPKDDESWFCKACVEKQQSAFKRRRRAK